MSKQRLPRVKRDIFGSMTARMNSEDFTETSLAKLASENPQLLFLADTMQVQGGLLLVALVYELLDSQAEADQMNREFK